MAEIPDFFLFDDDPVNNALCQITIKNTIKNAKIKTFTSPKRGLLYITNEYINTPYGRAILFLDINMHGMTCWEFLEQFEQLDGKIKERFNIFVLSASLSPVDKKRALSNKNVADYIEKPLTGDKIRNIISLN